MTYRVLIVHNKYQQAGGEDSVVETEADLLRAHGHEVHLYLRDNTEIDNMNRISLLAQTFWSRRTVRDIKHLVSSFRPDIIHAHNTFPLISPSLFWAANKLGIPVVQTMHNFRLLCAQASFLRDSKICQDCLGHIPWRGIIRKCYRGSLSQSAALVSMVSAHRAIGTYQNQINKFIALNEFCRTKLIDGGLPAERIMIKPNFVDVREKPDWNALRSGGLFVGRISPEKGTGVLAGALSKLPDVSFSLIGLGPDLPQLTAIPQIRSLGWLNSEAVYEVMRKSAYLVLPSILFENFPRTLVEAFACGLPVIASRLGPLADLITNEHTGLLFDPASADDLAKKIRWAESHPDKMLKMGIAAREEYETKYTASHNHQQLMEIYTSAIADSDLS